MILIVSNGRDVTADFFQERLTCAGVPHVRLDTEHLARTKLSFEVGGSSGRTSSVASFDAGNGRIDLDEIRAVYYRRPVPPEFPEGTDVGVREWMESETRRAWGGVLTTRPEMRWVNHPLSISGASYKPEQLSRAQRAGLIVPETLVTSDPDAAGAFCERHQWGVVTKPVGHGEILGATEDDDRIVYTSLLSSVASTRLDQVAACPTLFQQALSKDVDLRVTVVDETVISVALHSQERPASVVDCRRDNMVGMRYSLTTLPTDVEQTLIAFVRSYSLSYAAIDLVLDRDGRYWFLELNPAGQWAWLEQEADAPISTALIACLTEGM